MADNSMEPEPRDEESFRNLDARLRAARQREDAATGRDKATRGGPGPGMGLGMRVGVEMLAGLIIGTGIGLALDRWLGSAPWLMIVFLFAGATAGIMNAYRAVKGMDSSVGFGAAQRRLMKKTPKDE